jgi:transcriptional regulator with XRE-family HTH domain
MDKSLTRPEYRLFVSQLRKAREEAGLNQAELGKRLGETQSFISKVERGERRLDFVELDTFCGALEISVVDFAKRFERSVSASRRRTKKGRQRRA